MRHFHLHRFFEGIPPALGLPAGMVVWLFVTICFYLILTKANKRPGCLVWVPILQFIPVMDAADMEFAAAAGKSSMVMATWRSGGTSDRDDAFPRAMEKANIMHRNANTGFIGAVLLSAFLRAEAWRILARDCRYYRGVFLLGTEFASTNERYLGDTGIGGRLRRSLTELN